MTIKNKKYPHKLTATNNPKISSLSSKERAGGEVQLKCNCISLFLIPYSSFL